MARLTAERGADGENRRQGLVLAAIGVLVAAGPFAAGANTGWILLALLVAAAFLVAAFSVASDGDLDGPPPRGSG